MDTTTTAPEIIKILPAGVALYDKVLVEGKEMIVLFVKEEDGYINKWGKSPVVELRTGLMGNEKVMACPMIINVNQNADLFYELWINYHGNLGKEVFELLQEQTNIIIIITNENNISKRTISVGNNFNKEMLADINERLKKSEPWGMDEFDETKDSIIAKYPSVKHLWEAIQS